MMESLAAIARELYALAPGEFIAARNARAKGAADDGDRALATRIRALAKPSVAAWAVNALVRHRFDDVDALLDLGERMRAAQDALDRDAIREFSRDRQRMLAAIGRSARELGEELGTAVSEAATTEVQQTLQAAMGDEAAAAAVRDGTLVRTFSGSGLDPVDLVGAVAVPESLGAEAPPRPDRPPASDPAPAPASDRTPAAKATRGDELEARREARREAKRQAKQEAEEARQDAEAAEAELATLDLRIRDTTEERRERAEELRELKQRVEQLHDAAAELDLLAASLRKERTAAQRASDAAARAATRARQRYEKLP
jgi:hypothetical protein